MTALRLSLLTEDQQMATNISRTREPVTRRHCRSAVVD
jgi:hypothetical protein